MEQNLPIWGRTVRGLPQDWPLDAAGNPEAPALLLAQPESGLAGMTANMLSAFGVPVYQHYEDDGALARVVLGGSAYRVKLYVPASRLEEAQALLEAPPQEDAE